MFGDHKTSRRIVGSLSEEEEGGAAVETALLLGLAAFFALTMKHLIATPLLGTFTKAAQVLNQALSG